MIEKNSACVFAASGRRHIRRDTVVPHARAPGFCDRVTVIRPNPFAKVSEEEGFPEIHHCCTFDRFVRTMSDNVAKK